MHNSRTGGCGAAISTCVIVVLCAAVFMAAFLAGTMSYAQTAQPPSAAALTPPAEFAVEDAPSDSGRCFFLTWKKMPYDGPGVEYVVYMSSQGGNGPFEECDRFESTSRFKADVPWPFWAWNKTKEYHWTEVELQEAAATGKREKFRTPKTEQRWFKVAATDGTQTVETSVASAVAGPNWLNQVKLNNLLFMALFASVVLFFIAKAKKKDLFLRKIPGLSAVDEALGRATEMGKPIFFLTGRLGVSSISTIAATTILGEVAKKVAKYDTQLRVPHCDPIVLGLCQEVTKQAYLTAGRPDAYKEDSNYFITSDQFAYTAAVDGQMLRERPAACFYMGYYYAEALLLAEAGAGVGAIQIAGSDADTQLPFFVTVCDYTLIGEELYAASAYLSREPVLLGSLRGQDIGKIVIMIVLLLGVLLGTIWVLFDLQRTTGIPYTRLLEPFRAF
ncbi:MAG: hypothetical protein RDV41_03225 [Planctomycetota bacterium]|nr:hypothetical protein [Planctomycetota bacterium]